MEELPPPLSDTRSIRRSRTVPLSPPNLSTLVVAAAAIVLASFFGSAQGIRFPNRIPDPAAGSPTRPTRTAVFALGSFWRSEAVFGCLGGVVRTAVGYAGGSKPNPEYRSLRDHAECVQVEYDPRLISYRQLLDVFWSSHDSRQVLGQGPDVGNQYRSIIFTNGTEESRLAALSKEREQTKSKSSVVTTQTQHLETFYPAEPEHQKFELKRNPLLLQLMGNLPEEELQRSRLAAKMNSFAAELCPPHIQKQIDAKIGDIIRKSWPLLRNV
ncbi:peptide methionine sulfoxide reductase A5-like [Syzygium oleosum]|uniref:peptide methionine sulfoxide reductase A5-like n=1 Tax=Syzygium oleosum TaxID=219896 RepID=UPI0024BB5332|nr:peptide methionine sulfoxide reductase A5-like [Syzygium oleosum]